MPTILPLSKSSIQDLSSGQVIPSLHSAIKELLENALDAGSSVVEIKLTEHGAGAIEVVDNGFGVSRGDLRWLGRRSCTSKLVQPTDGDGQEGAMEVDVERRGGEEDGGGARPLDLITTFGFRGEALSSLIAICERVSVTTASSEDAPPGYQIDDLGQFISETENMTDDELYGYLEKVKRVARLVSLSLRERERVNERYCQRGTTIKLFNIFHTLPVRRKELLWNTKREYTKVLSLLTSYALVPCSCPSTSTSPTGRGVRLSISNQISKRFFSCLKRITCTE